MGSTLAIGQNDEYVSVQVQLGEKYSIWSTLGSLPMPGLNRCCFRKGDVEDPGAELDYNYFSSPSGW